MYRLDPFSDEYAVALPSSPNGNTNEKKSSVNILSYTAEAEPEDGVTSIGVPERDEEIVSVWDSGYPQPLRFVPIA